MSTIFGLSDEEIYDMVRSGALHSFPAGFWDGVTGKESAIKLVNYLFNKILNWSIDDIKNDANYQLFMDNKLISALDKHFDGSYFLALASSYPELKEWGEDRYKEVERGDKYNDLELILMLQNKAKELGKTPNFMDMDKPGGQVFSGRFGSWEKALIAAGFKQDIYVDVEDTEDAKQLALYKLKKYVYTTQTIPSRDEILTLISEGELKTYFRSYNRLIGILQREYTKEELIKILNEKHKQLNRMPSINDIKIPFPVVFINQFGSWEDALKASGIK